MADNVTVKDASESNIVMRATDNASVYTPHTIVDSGTVTANLSATDNAVLDTIDAVLDTINAKLAGGTVIGDVNLGATDNAVLDSIATNTGNISSDQSTETTLAACLTALQLIDNAISGNEMQVDIVGALPAGTNAIGKLAANSGVDIGDVDVTSLPGNVQNALTGEYETVAASQTAQVIGATGGTGDFIAGVLIVPATTSPGNVLLLDNATSITIFTGGADSVSNLVPFYVPLNLVSTSGAWKLTTGANVSAIASGNFT